jgi:hypothetical protein
MSSKGMFAFSFFSPSYCSHTSLAIREYDAKLLLAYWLERAPPADKSATVVTKFVYPTVKVAQISWDPTTNTITPDSTLPSWVFTTKLVAKPDQLIKRRGKAGLLALNKTWEEAKPWIAARAGKPQKVGIHMCSSKCVESIRYRGLYARLRTILRHRFMIVILFLNFPSSNAHRARLRGRVLCILHT